MNPKQINSVPENRRAVAPYNFVELPEKVVEAEDLPEGERYHPNENVEIPRHTGRIECTLTTKSPLYTRRGWSPEDFAKYGDTSFKDLPEKLKNERANFFINPATNQPTIPGSSLRGMLRTLVEIVSFSKIDRVTENKLFYRSLGDRALRDIYSANFVEDIGQVRVSPHPQADCYRSKVHAGFLRKSNNSCVIEECGYGRIERQSNNRVIPNLPNQPNISTKPIYQGTGPGRIPSGTYQHQTIYVSMDRYEQDYFFRRQTNSHGRQRHPNLYLRFRKVHSASLTPSQGLQKGTLVITGDMQHKHLEFVFLEETLNKYLVSEEMVRRFQDDDQITKWQEKAYPKDKPSAGCRQRDGYLTDGEPVFFLLDDDGETIRFFGRAQMFRLPYEYSPLDFVPHPLRDASRTDIAEAIFGYVDGKPPREKARASRVFVSDGILTSNQELQVQESQDREAREILLSSPKPTTFQHYLVQITATQDQLKHYASQPPSEKKSGETVIRGHKLYWHKTTHIEVPANASDTQTSLIKPLDSEIKFTFTIHFENLSKVELGALLWVLSLSSEKLETLETGKLGETYCFSLGMGKPLGMGAVKIDYKLHLSDRTSRYQNLFDGDSWNICEESAELQQEQDYIRDFENFMLDDKTGISENDHPKNTRAKSLKEVPRIEMLLAMLQCQPNIEVHRLADMELDEFRNRPVLPTPLDLMNIQDNRIFTSVNSSSENQTEIQSTEPPKKSSDFPKPKLKKNADIDGKREHFNQVIQRPPKNPKR